MRLKDYGRNQQKRKQFVNQPDLLLVGVDVSKSKHDACFAHSHHSVTFSNTREGFTRFEAALRTHMEQVDVNGP